MKPYILPFIIIVLIALVVVLIAAVRTATHKADSASARAEAAKQAEAQAQSDLSACLEREKQTAKARAIETQTTRDMEIKQHEAQAKFNEIRSDSCNLNDGAMLDQRVRELAIDAYRVAICTESSAADSTKVPATAGSGAP